MQKRKRESKVDIHPEQIYLTSKQYDAIKNQQPNKPFKIEDKRVAQQLLANSFIQEETKRVCEEFRLEDKVMSRYVVRSSGEYLLTAKGEYYIDYRKKCSTNHFWSEFRAWVTLLIAVLGLVVSFFALWGNVGSSEIINNYFYPKDYDDFVEDNSDEEIETETEFHVEIKVRLVNAVDKSWHGSVYAEVGDIVEFQMQYKNISDESHRQVVVRDVLPPSLEYIEGSTTLYNGNHPDGTKAVQDTIATYGVNIGNYASGANAFIRFRAEVISDTLAEGANLLHNWGQVQAGSVEKVILQDDACVIVNYHKD